MIVAPSILSSNFNNLLDDVKTIQDASFLHIDVMDGLFVPNISFGPLVFKGLRKEIDMVFDVHLMINDPIKYIKDFAMAGSDIITFHYEANSDAMDTIKEIRKYEKKVGISIKPNTNEVMLSPILPYVDLVLVMSVEPGFGGQKFMDNALQKIKYLDNIRKTKGYHYMIEVDGGINLETAKKCRDNGCDIVVCGSFLFNKNNNERLELIKEFEKL